MDEQMKFLKII